MSVPAHSRPDGTELAPSDQAGRPEERERVAARHRGEAPAQERDAGPAPTAAVRWRAARAHPGPASAAGPGATTRALAVLTEFLAVAEHVSLGGYRAAVAASRGAGARDARA